MESQAESYDASFYDGWRPITASSAEVIAPIILRLTGARSVADFGCGSGVWLAAFQRAGVETIQGYDGPWVEVDRLPFPGDQFAAVNLAEPVEAGRRFDLAISLEVAEHLPAAASDVLVASIVSAADVVMFSASIRSQGGVGHINEQWPAYWIEKFAHHDYVVIDGIRPEVWDDPRVAHFYRQNVGVYVRRERLDDYPALQAIHQATTGRFPALVHPITYQNALDRAADVRGLVVEQAKQKLGPLRPAAARAKQRFSAGARRVTK